MGGQAQGEGSSIGGAGQRVLGREVCDAQLRRRKAARACHDSKTISAAPAIGVSCGINTTELLTNMAQGLNNLPHPSTQTSPRNPPLLSHQVPPPETPPPSQPFPVPSLYPTPPPPRVPTLGLPYASVRMVTLLTVPHPWKCSCSSSGVVASGRGQVGGQGRQGLGKSK